MRGSRLVHHRPYIPPNRPTDKHRPYICRLAPEPQAFELEWLRREEGVHGLFVSKRGQNEYRRIELNTPHHTGRKPGCKYRIRILYRKPHRDS